MVGTLTAHSSLVRAVGAARLLVTHLRHRDALEVDCILATAELVVLALEPAGLLVLLGGGKIVVVGLVAILLKPTITLCAISRLPTDLIPAVSAVPFAITHMLQRNAVAEEVVADELVLLARRVGVGGSRPIESDQSGLVVILGNGLGRP